MSYTSPFLSNVIQPSEVSYRAITLSADTTLAWPINGTLTGDYAAGIMEVTATAANLSLLMPPANQVSTGQSALIRNVGSNTFTLKDYSGGTIVVPAAGEAKFVYVETNSTAAGTWGVVAFGVGTSNVDASTLAGYGLKAISNTLNTKTSVTTFSSDTTADATYRAGVHVWTGGAGTLTLTASATLGNDWYTYVRNSGTGSLTVSTTGGDLFDGSTSIVLQPNDSCLIACSGSAFYSVGLGKSTQFNFTQNSKDVAAGGTFTLTSGEAQNVIQKFTGTLAGNVIIIVPQTIQVYYINNATDGGLSDYTLTVKTSAGGAASVVLHTGELVTVVCDSTNVYNANTVQTTLSAVSVGDGAVGAPSINFTNESTTGIYRSGAGKFDIAILGVNQFELSATGLVVPSGISGGTF